MPAIVIGLSGKRRSGKTLAAEYFIDFEPFFQKMSFADSLREMFSIDFGVPIAYLTDDARKESYREALIGYSKAKKEADPNIFINHLLERIGEHDLVVIDDVRFIPEYAAVIRVGGVCYKVECDSVRKALRGWTYDPIIDTDSSETELDIPGFIFQEHGGGVIWNNKSKDDLAQQVQEILLRL